MPKFVFSHIPRTGGTSFRKLVGASLSKTLDIDSVAQLAFTSDEALQDYDFVASHCGFAMFRRFPRSATTVTILRDPVERIVSQYFYLRECADSFSASPYARELSLLDFVECDIPAVSMFVRNTQTFHVYSDKNLTGKFRNDLTPNKEILNRAKQNLSSVSYVGIFDRIEEFYQEFAARERLPLKSFHERPTLGVRVPEKQRARIAQFVQMDIELYEFAKKSKLPPVS